MLRGLNRIMGGIYEQSLGSEPHGTGIQASKNYLDQSENKGGGWVWSETQPRSSRRLLVGSGLAGKVPARDRELPARVQSRLVGDAETIHGGRRVLVRGNLHSQAQGHLGPPWRHDSPCPSSDCISDSPAGSELTHLHSWNTISSISPDLPKVDVVTVGSVVQA